MPLKPKPHNTMRLPLKQTSVVLHTALPREEFAIRILSTGIFMLLAAYITLVSMSIVNVIARTEASERVTEIRATLGELERDYFALSQDITASRGDALGLAPISDIHYIHVPGAVGAALENEREL